MGVVETVKSYGYRKVWGEHSLTVGELVGVIIGLLVLTVGSAIFKKWALWVGLAVMIVAMILF